MSQCEEILNYLRTAPLTPIEALNKFGCLRLAARIKDLKDEGHKIVTLTVNKNGKKFARYVMVKEKR